MGGIVGMSTARRQRGLRLNSLVIGRTHHYSPEEGLPIHCSAQVLDPQGVDCAGMDVEFRRAFQASPHNVFVQFGCRASIDRTGQLQ